MFTFPDITPITEPVLLTVAMPSLSELQLPPLVALLRLIDWPSHTADDPPIADGRPFTSMLAVRTQPVGAVYVMIVLPADTPFTLPDASIVAADGLLLVQVPPPTLLLSTVD